MKPFFKGLLLICVVLAALPLAAADLLFVFRGDTAEAAVYDADSMSLVANPSVGFGAAQVLGIPSEGAAHGFAKFFVVGRDSVAVLGADFQLRRSIAFGEAVADGRSRGVLVDGASRLLVAAGSELLVIDTAEERVVRMVDLPFVARALAAVPSPERVFVLAEGSSVLRQLNLDSFAIEESAGLMPEVIRDVVSAPSGAFVYGVSGRSFHDLRSAATNGSSTQLDLRAAVLAALSQDGAQSAQSVEPAGQPNQRFTVADNGRYATISGGQVYTGWLGGSSDATQVLLSGSGQPSDLNAGGVALSSDGQHLFVAEKVSHALLKIDVEQTGQPQSAALSFEPSAIALVSPVVGQTAGMLEQVSPPRQTVAGGKSFTLDVRALGANSSPQSNVTLFASGFNPATPVIECFSDVTDSSGVGSVYCTASEVTAPRLVRVTVSDTTGRSAPSFEIALVPPTEGDGLTKKSGDFEAVPEDSEFQLVVAASENRVPQKGLGLVITPVPGRPTVQCPPQVFTDDNGEATITCTAGVVSDPETANVPVDVMITVRDASRSVVFTITIDPDLTISEGLAIVSGNDQRTSNHVDVPFPLVVRSVIDGVPQAAQSLAISVSHMAALTCPVQVFTDEEGFGFIKCRGGVVFGEEKVFVTVGGPRGSQVQFSVIVRATPQGLANDIEILTAQPIEAIVGEVRPNAVRVIATTTGGQRVAGRTIYFTSEDGVTFDPPTVITDGFGEATTTVTFGCSNRNRGSIEVGFSEDEVEDSIDFTLTPGPFARIDKLQGDNQTGTPGQTLTGAALLVQVGDACGNPLTQQKVNWRIHPEPRASFRNLVDITNQSGRSSVLVQLGSYGGPFTVTAQAGEAMATFNLNVALDPSKLQRLSGDNQMAAPGTMVAQPLVVEVTGSNGFGVSGVDVTFEVTQGSATLTRSATKSDGLGVAYTSVQMGSGPATVTASALGQSVTFTLRSGSGGGPQAPLEGFVNGASFRAGWVPGSLGTIFGTGITGVSGVVTSGPVPFETTLEGVSVTVNGIAAPIVSLVNVEGQEQINLQVPFGIPAGTATVVINNNGSSVTISDVPILATQPGIFEFGLDGTLYAAALHADYSVVTPENPAHPGEVILLFVTGLGVTDPAVTTNQPGPSTAPLARTVMDPTVNLNNSNMENSGGYYAPGLATAYQINFVVWDGVSSGNLDIYVVINGVSSQTSKLPVQNP